jgi:hypothetical protein
MKVLLAICFWGLPVTLPAQTALRTFTSEDRAFQFKYSPMLVHCVPQRAEKGYGRSWAPAEACLSQDGLCDDEDSPATTIACFAYPKDEFREKPAFGSAAFFVAQVPTATTPKACLEGSPDWLILSARGTMISSVGASFFHISDAGLGGRQEGDIYRVFHNNVCYELGIQEETTNPAAFDPGSFKEFSKQDQAEVRARLKQPLEFFSFSK